MSAGSQTDQPLKDKSALLVCSPLKARELTGRLKSLGAEVIPFQAIEIRPLNETAELDSALRSLKRYDLIIFTSSYGVLNFARRMRDLGVPIEEAAHIRVCAIGPATAQAARENGITVSITPGEFVAEGVIVELARRAGGLEKLQGQRILIPRAKEAREVLPQELRTIGAIVDVAPCYETVQAPVEDGVIERIQARPPHLAVFTSSSNVTKFAAIAGDEATRKILCGATVAVIGPITARTVAQFGKQAEIIPDQNSIPALLAAIRRYYQESA
jgi:uroporphyrinogen III methyltransferase/synthase